MQNSIIYLTIVSAKDKEDSFEDEDSAEALGKEISCRFLICFNITMNAHQKDCKKHLSMPSINFVLI